MNINDIRLIKKSARYPIMIAINEECDDAFEAFCIRKLINSWECHYQERGIVRNRKIFQNEEDACNYFIAILKDESII